MAIDNKEVNSVNIKTGTKPLDYWKDEIRSAIRYRTVYGKSQEWQRYKNMYRGFWGKDVVPVNIIYSTGRSLVPQIYFRSPRASVFAKKPGYTMHARVLERIDNYLIGETGLKEELKSLVLDCYLCGRGPGIIGYDSEFGFNPSFMSDDYFDSGLTSFNEKGLKIEYNIGVKPGMPWFMRCNPSDFLVPWGTRKWGDNQWFAFRVMRPLRDIQEDPKYKNKTGLKAPYKSRLEASSEQQPVQPKLQDENIINEWVEIWQIHDQRTGRVFALSLDHDKFLRDEIDYLQTEGLPAKVLGFNEDPDFFWWAPDARYIAVQQLELNDIRTMAKKHRRVALLKVLYDKGQLGKDDLAKLLDEDPKAAVAIDAGANGDVRRAVALLQSHVAPDFTIAAKEVREDIKEIIGMSRNQQGSFEAPSGRRSATEANIVQQASMIRIDERRDIMADMLESVIRAYNQLIFANWTTERVIDIIGQDGARYWVRFTGREIRGEFDYKINPEESIPSDKRTKTSEVAAFMGMAKEIPGMDMKYLMETYASQFDWVDPKLLFPGEGPGRSPEKAMNFYDLMRMGPQGSRNSPYPALGGELF